MHRWLALPLCIAFVACGGTTDSSAPVNHGSIAGSAKFSGDTGDQSGIAIVLVGPTPGATVTDGSGGYSFTGLAAGTYLVSATSGDSLEGTASVKVELAKDASATAGAIALSPAGSVGGKAQLAGQTSSAGVTVAVLGTTLAATTASDGAFSFHGLPAGAVKLVFSKTGYAGAALDATIQRGKTADAGTTTLTGLAGTSSIHGKAVDSSGAGVPGVGVLATGPATAFVLTGSDGTFSLDQLTAGTYRVAIGGPDVAPHETDANVTVTAGNTSTMTNTQVTPVGAIAGTVDTAGLAQRLPVVALLRQGTDALDLSALVTPGGAFTLRDVPAGSGYSVRLSGAGALSDPVDAPDVVRGQTSVIADTFTLPATSQASVDLHGEITLVGGESPDFFPAISKGGALVTIGDPSAEQTFTHTAQDGTWSATVASGGPPVSIDDELYHAAMPPVLALPGTNGLVVDGATAPLSSPLEVQAGNQFLDSSRIGGMCPARRSPFAEDGFDTGWEHDALYLADYECPATLLPGGSNCQGECCNGCCVGLGCVQGSARPVRSGFCLSDQGNQALSGPRRTNPAHARRTEIGPGGVGIESLSCAGKLVIVTPDGRHGVVPDWPILEGSYQEGPQHTVLYFTGADPQGRFPGTLRLAVLPDAPPGAAVDPIVFTLGHAALTAGNFGFTQEGNKVAYLANLRLDPTGYSTLVDLMVVDVTAPASPVTVAAGLLYRPNVRFLPGGDTILFSSTDPEGGTTLKAAPTAACTLPDGCVVNLGSEFGTGVQVSRDNKVLGGEINNQTLKFYAIDGSGSRTETVPGYFVNDYGMLDNGYVYVTYDNESGNYRWWITPISAAASSSPTMILDNGSSFGPYGLFDGAHAYTYLPPAPALKAQPLGELVSFTLAASSTLFVWPVTPESSSPQLYTPGPGIVAGEQSPHGRNFYSCDPVAATCTKFISDRNASVYTYDSLHFLTLEPQQDETTQLVASTYDGSPPQVLHANLPNPYLRFLDSQLVVLQDPSCESLWVRRFGNPDLADSIDLGDTQGCSTDASPLADGSLSVH
ncbi:MAG: carboxypeptidase regulatory-like domain-containing protein, partial [Deltaproteobacteria bacterium]|nr:carboxypeptidase regulatory-like domain-containing protein [Deltaproteobacteria bacterium]